jgi:predicted dehydrogenase
VDRSDALEVVAEKGTALIDVAHHDTVFWQTDGSVSRDPILDPSSLSRVSLALRYEVEDFVRCIRGERDAPETSLEDAVHGVEVIEAMIQSAVDAIPVVI